MTRVTSPATISVPCDICGEDRNVYVHLKIQMIDDSHFSLAVDDVDTQETYDHYLMKHMNLDSLE